MFVDAKVLFSSPDDFDRSPAALASAAARNSQNREARGLATLRGCKTNLCGGIDVNPQIEGGGAYVAARTVCASRR
jgi:hypothetical protein